MICQNCGNEMSEGANFCRHCGAPATAAKEPVPVKKRHIRRALVSLLLFFIFAGGLAVSGWFEFNAWQKYNAPYQEAAFAALEEELSKTEGCAEKIAGLEVLLETNARETRELEATLALYHTQRESEILGSVTDSVELDYNALFTTEPFSSAYLQYIDDLLSAFQQDRLADGWLYPYYTYSLECGANPYIDLDLWIYDGAGENEKFSELLTDPQHFYVSAYTSTLTDHLALNNHLYVTGMDMLNTFFRIPGYVLDGAVFVKAYGGNPSPEDMKVPGWAPQDYINFWEDADSYLFSDHAVWEDFGLSAVDFDIDWNTLVDEDAYYKVYEKFMDIIAPGLDRYDMAQYAPDDEYYGGVRYELSGSEATLKEIAAAYIADNPDCLAELGIDTDTLPSSYDSLIADGKVQLEELAETAEDLELQKAEATRLQAGKAFLLQQQETLLAMQEQHVETLTVTLWVFALICVFLFAMAIASLRWLVRSLR